MKTITLLLLTAVVLSSCCNRNQSSWPWTRQENIDINEKLNMIISIDIGKDDVQIEEIAKAIGEKIGMDIIVEEHVIASAKFISHSKFKEMKAGDILMSLEEDASCLVCLRYGVLNIRNSY